MTETVANAIHAATHVLSDTSDTARLDAELLIAHALGVSRSDMLLLHMQDAPPESFAALIERRAVHEPVAYLIGQQEFYGRSFRVTPDVLIPRGDSELLIDTALEADLTATRVLDLGTGSGALLVTVLLELAGSNGIATDASQAALGVAEDNACRLGLSRDRAQFLLADWKKPGWAQELGRFDLILCNPPYVEDDAVLDPDVRAYEPAGALFAGPEGLDDYQVLIPQLRDLLNKNGVAVFEIGATQHEAVAAIVHDCALQTVLRRDLAGRPRALVIKSAG